MADGIGVRVMRVGLTQARTNPLPYALSQLRKNEKPARAGHRSAEDPVQQGDFCACGRWRSAAPLPWSRLAPPAAAGTNRHTHHLVRW